MESSTASENLDYVLSVKISPDMSKIALAFDYTNTHPFYLVILYAANGTVNAQYGYTNTYGKYIIYQDGLLWDSTSTYLYIAIAIGSTNYY